MIEFYDVTQPFTIPVRCLLATECLQGVNGQHAPNITPSPVAFLPDSFSIPSPVNSAAVVPSQLCLHRVLQFTSCGTGI